MLYVGIDMAKSTSSSIELAATLDELSIPLAITLLKSPSLPMTWVLEQKGETEISLNNQKLPLEQPQLLRLCKRYVLEFANLSKTSKIQLQVIPADKSCPKNVDYLKGKSGQDEYRVAKELPGGGFSKTFIANLPDPPQKQVLYKLATPEKAMANSRINATRSIVDIKLAKEAVDYTFANEAQILEKLSELSATPKLYQSLVSENLTFIAMEFLQGDNLLELWNRDRSLFSEAKVLYILQQVAKILVEVHKEKIVHLDIKPENIIWDREKEKISLIDFREAREKSFSIYPKPKKPLTFTKGFASPELEKNHATESSDFYSLAATACFLLTGKKVGQTFTVNDLDQLNHSFKQFLIKQLHSTPVKRSKSATQLLQELRDIRL